MVLGDRHIDNLVGTEDVFIKRPCLEHQTVDLCLPEPALVDIIHLRACGRSRLMDAALYITSARIVDRPVENLYFLGSRLQAHPHQGRHYFRVCICSLLRKAVPSDVWFYYYDIAFRDEFLHASQGIYGCQRDRCRIRPSDYNEVGLCSGLTSIGQNIQRCWN